MQQIIINQYLSSIRPAHQKMILTIDTCMAAMYVSFSFFFVYCQHSIGIWPVICSMSHCHSLGSKILVPSACPQMIQSSSSSKGFSTTSKFPSHCQADEGRRQSAVLLNVLESLFSRRMMARKVLLRCIFFISIWSLYPVAKFCTAPLPGDVQHPHLIL